MSTMYEDDAVSAAQCYRHPGRETLVRCGSCERPICTDCMVETPVGMRCPECARGPRTTADARVARARRQSAGRYVTIALIVVNVVAFVFEYIRAGNGPIDSGLLFDMGGVYGPAIAHGEPWRLLTGGFLHGGTLHIVLNMMALWFIGTILEDGIGAVNTALIYLAAVLWGSAGAVLMDPTTVTVGASGGVFGLMGALLVVARQQGVRELTTSLVFTLAINLVFTFAVPGISIGGHIGGLLGGVVACLLLTRRGQVSSRPSPVGVAAVGVVAAAAVAAGVYLAHNPVRSTAGLAPPSASIVAVGVLRG
ncbi:MAG: rhomboid family intramembrane serine protease [Thermoleophilia bacterium]|nr:rhomboid family intramembrane serine protease [Thermoleophilia bacterium]